jgi:hypothetical protein
MLLMNRLGTPEPSSDPRYRNMWRRYLNPLVHVLERGSNSWMGDDAKQPALTGFGARCSVGTDTLDE